MDPSVILALIVELYAAGKAAQARIAELEAELAAKETPEGEPHGND